MYKRIVIVGGASGVGLAVAREMSENGWRSLIVDRVQPPHGPQGLDPTEYDFQKCDLSFFDASAFEELAGDPSVQGLIITAGFGRVAAVGDLKSYEVRNLMEVNAAAPIGILRIFWDRITSDETFYCAVMSSIAGMVASPYFSVYAASKAALWRFSESANCELAAEGKTNRITCIAPGHIMGTAFDGGAARASGLQHLAQELVDVMMHSAPLWVPDPEGIYRGVLERYARDPERFGAESATYKLESGRLNGGRKPVVGYCSGTFDLFHVGHLNLLKAARSQCDQLVVGVHPDASHKGKETFVPLNERKAIVSSCRYVDRVIDAPREDCDAWDSVKYGKLFVGSDYKGTERFARYEKLLGAKGVEIVYFPYTVGTSSTQLRSAISKKID